MNIFMLALFPMISIAVFIVLYLIFGREPKVDYEGIYEREPPYDYSPALVNALINQDTGMPDMNGFHATILDLVRKGYLSIRRIKSKNNVGEEEWEISKTAKGKKYYNDTELSEAEKKVIKIIFIDTMDNKESLNTFKRLIGVFPHLNVNLDEWKKKVNKELYAKKLLGENTGVKVYNVFILISSIVLFLMISLYKSLSNTAVANIYENISLSILLGIVTAMIITLIFRQALPARTKEGAEHYNKWLAFKKFLSNFSKMKEYPVEAMVLWNKYMIYAVALDEAKTINKEFQPKALSEKLEEYDTSCYTLPHNTFSALKSLHHALDSVVKDKYDERYNAIKKSMRVRKKKR